MNAAFQQNARMGRLTTGLGKDVLNLLRFDGEEFLNGLFSYRIEALATDDALDFDVMIGTHATVHLSSFDLPETPFDGIITEAELLGQTENGWRYGITLRPWFWLAGLRRKQQIYHNKTVVQILDELFEPYGGMGQPAVEKNLTGDYAVLEYTVQYRESDLAFATRLMERFGISYHFRHGDGTHTMVLTDNITAHAFLPRDSRMFQHVKGAHRADQEHFWEMRPAQRLTTGKVRLTDYNFKHPDAAMEVDRDGGAPYAEGQLEGYDYPGDYLDQDAGSAMARLRIDQERGQDPRHRAVGDCASLRAGQRVDVTGDKVSEVGASLCLSARHSYQSGSYGSHSAEAPTYEGQYLLMPAAAPLRPERKSPRPVVQGPQTARVVGDGEIDCDEYGRILVRFHWDLDNRFSMRCRVSQNWAGKGWGGMVIPRIGMEVVVEFLEGDPDKPLVTGCVYNGKNDPPYELPENKTRSTFKTDTHRGQGFNELRFEDEKDNEEIFLHAQKDRNTKVENNQSERVNMNKVESIGQNKAIEVGNNLFEIVDGNMDLRVGPANKGSYTPSGASEQTQGIGAVPEMLGKGARKGIGDLNISVENTKTQVIGRDHFEVVDGDKDTQVRKNQTTKVRQKIRIEAGDEILLVCGKSRIRLSDDGTIEINGQKILQLGDKLVSIQSDAIKLN